MTTDQPITQLDHYRLLGRSGLRISPLCLGTMTFGTEWGWGSDKATSRQIFDRFVERGGNFFDTADFYTYGTSEEYLGEFIAADRDRHIVATKYTNNITTGAGKQGTPDPNAGGNHRKRMVRGVEASLERLKTDYIDLFWLHIWDWTTPVDELMRGLDDLVRAGKVLYLAISDTPAWKIAQCNTYAECHALTRFVATQVNYSLVLRDVERDIMPMCRELGVALLPWSPLGGGVLSGKYTRQDLEAQERAGALPPVFGGENRSIALNERKLTIAEEVIAVARELGRTPAQVSLNWLLSRPGVTSLIIGARTLAQLDDNLSSLDFTIPEALRERLETVSAIVRGFPHDFINSVLARDIISGGTSIQFPRPDLP